jgi:lipoate-protein ligase A
MLAGALIAGLGRIGVTATIGSARGAEGPACFAAAQGADLRVGERKLCGSAQVQRGPAVLQHGSVLLDRLPFDELDLLHAPQSRTLRARAVTLRELGVAHDAPTVAAVLAAGFAETLDLDFGSRVTQRA